MNYNAVLYNFLNKSFLREGVKIPMNTCKKLLLCFYALMILIPPPTFAADYIPGDVIVVLRPSDPEIMVTASDLDDFGTESFRVASFAAESGAWVKNTYASLSEAGNEVFALIHSDKKTTEELVQELMNNPEVVAVSPNYKVYAANTVPDDPLLSECWGLEYINAYGAWDIATGSEEVYVAVIDSGIDHTNPDLTANVDTDLGQNTRYGNSYSALDDYGHGTHVAGIIGAVGNNGMGSAGVNWKVKMISVKALDSRGEGYLENVIDAMNYVTELIDAGKNIRVVNLSLETYLTTKPNYDNLIKLPLWHAFKSLDDRNKAVIVVAAGNQGETIGQPSTKAHGSMVRSAGCYVYPPSFKGLYGMISVSALDRDGSLADFSNKGADISAPGVDILSTWIQGTSSGVSMNTKTGTSMAAPYISGAAALLASVIPDATAYQIKQILLLSGAVSSAEAAGGVLDIRAAMDFKDTAEAAAIPAKSTEWSEYDGYADNNTSTQTTTGNNDSNNGNDGQESNNNNDNNNNSNNGNNGNNLYNWDNNTNDTPDTETIYEDGDGGGGGTCGAEKQSLWAVLLLFPLVKRCVC